MTPRARNIEVRYAWVSVGIVALFSAAFAIGLVLYLLDPGSRGAELALHGGLMLLMASPALRILVATAERVRRRDILFLVMTVAVVVELGIVFWRA